MSDRSLKGDIIIAVIKRTLRDLARDLADQEARASFNTRSEGSKELSVDTRLMEL